MISRVKIKIESIIDNLDASGLADGESEKSVSTVDGIYHYGNDGARISYKEENEGGKSESEILVFSDSVKVSRHGAIESVLYFKEGETHSSIYQIPPYRFDAEVRAKRVSIELSPIGGKINLVYNMKIGGAEKSAIMRIWISKATNQA
jgi:uncharacterized beta-barrel protein YwiB (DUF1934 family)